jgi:hypothetical protein
MRSTRGEVITQALQRVGNTTTTLKTQARIRLNRILQELQQGWDWPYLWTTTPITIGSNGIVPLPANFLKAEDDQSLFIQTIGGNTTAHVVTEVDHRTFAMLGQGLVSASAPRVWTLDYGTLTGQVWPLPNDTCQGTLRCKLLPPDFPVILSPDNSSLYDADVPLFPWDTLLTDLLFEWAMSYEVDPRRAEQMAVNVDTVNRSRGASFPEKSYPTQVQLDPTIFSRPWQGNN